MSVRKEILNCINWLITVSVLCITSVVFFLIVMFINFVFLEKRKEDSVPGGTFAYSELYQSVPMD